MCIGSRAKAEDVRRRLDRRATVFDPGRLTLTVETV